MLYTAYTTIIKEFILSSRDVNFFLEMILAVSNNNNIKIQVFFPA